LVQNENLINSDAVLPDIQNIEDADLVPENPPNGNYIGPVDPRPDGMKYSNHACSSEDESDDDHQPDMEYQFPAKYNLKKRKHLCKKWKNYTKSGFDVVEFLPVEGKYKSPICELGGST